MPDAPPPWLIDASNRPADATISPAQPLAAAAGSGRAPWEYAATLAAMPWLSRLPRGDGHPVIVFPGLGASELSTRPLRSFLRQLGLRHLRLGPGPQPAARTALLDSLPPARAARWPRAMARKVSLVGWSLGGVYARELAKQLEPQTRCVITLGSPFSGHARATNAARAYELYQRPAAAARPGARRAPAPRAARADHVDLQQERRRRRLAMQPERRRAAHREHRDPRQPPRPGRQPAGAVCGGRPAAPGSGALAALRHAGRAALAVRGSGDAAQAAH